MAAFIRDFTQTREGGAMIALAGADPEVDAYYFRELAMGDDQPFHFERRGKRADGSQTHVAFTLAFAHARTMPGRRLLHVPHEKPENFWDKGLQDHANGATGVSKVTIVAENPADHAEFLSHFTQVRAFHSSSMGVEFLLGEGQKIEVLTPLAFEFHHGPRDWNADDAPHIAAVELRTSSIAAATEALTHGRVAHEERNGRILVAPSAASGVTIAFAP